MQIVSPFFAPYRQKKEDFFMYGKKTGKRLLSWVLVLIMALSMLPLNVLAEYLLPYVRVGGRMLCWKGPAVREEMAAGERACKMLGGQAEGLYRLPIEGREHYVHSAIKISATARRYPRKSGTPSKDPLGILPQKP